MKLFHKHKWQLVFCSKKYDKSLHVCNGCGQAWWVSTDELKIGREDPIKKKELL